MYNIAEKAYRYSFYPTPEQGNLPWDNLDFVSPQCTTWVGAKNWALL
ncbi:MAG: hypothetical protein EA414_16845 [Arthrospira sp. PLM2.Bin9]|nr:MAG: hypothetical protein EA414_16845 [Arthrospira sp. PLM2.Bin9]